MVVTQEPTIKNMLQSNVFQSTLCKENKSMKWFDYAKLKENQYKAKVHIEEKNFKKIKLWLKESMQSYMRTRNIFCWGKCWASKMASSFTLISIILPYSITLYHILYLHNSTLITIFMIIWVYHYYFPSHLF